jgi:hypothetical protein
MALVRCRAEQCETSRWCTRDVRFASKVTEVMRCRELTRWGPEADMDGLQGSAMVVRSATVPHRGHLVVAHKRQ